MRDVPSDGWVRLDITKPHSARRYNYLLGGKDNYAIDRASADALLKALPTIGIAAQENRRFLQRLVTWLVREHGITQFLDIGTGLPTADNTHDVAQAIDPTARIVYVDNDPLVLVHARALLTSHPAGETAYLQADLRDSDVILNHADLRATLDLTQPVALMCIAVLHFIPDDTAIRRSLRALLNALPSGSIFALSHASYDDLPDHERERLANELKNEHAHGTTRLRTRSELGNLIADLGLDLIDPGIVSIVDWRPDLAPQPATDVTPAEVLCWAAVAQRP